jgi:PQQ-dependent dehydrogenase (methanol/ethanol family)
MISDSKRAGNQDVRDSFVTRQTKPQVKEKGMITRRFAVSLAMVLPSLAAANEEVQQLIDDSSNWAIWGGDYAGTRYSELDQIDRGNVGDLQVAWTFSTGVLRGHEGGPLVVGDTLYIHTPFPNKVFSINLDDQSINWTYAPNQSTDTIPVMCCDTVNRGLAYADGKIFLQQADTWLVALDADSGEVIWRARNGDPARGETNTNAPLVVKDKVITGISGGEYGVRGFVVAYDIDSGEEVWKAYSVGPDEELLVDPENTTHLGEPIGENSSLSTWRASSGGSAAVRPGAGSLTTPSSIFSTTGPAIRAHGTRLRDRATTAGA